MTLLVTKSSYYTVQYNMATIGAETVRAHVYTTQQGLSLALHNHNLGRLGSAVTVFTFPRGKHLLRTCL